MLQFTNTQTLNFTFNIYDPFNTATYQACSIDAGGCADDNGFPMTTEGYMFYQASASTVMKRFAFYLSTGDWNAGTSTLYGRVA